MEASNPAHNGSRAFTAEGSVRREGGPAAEVSTFCSCGVAVSPAEAACGGGAHTEVPHISPSPAAATAPARAVPRPSRGNCVGQQRQQGRDGARVEEEGNGFYSFSS